jgi:hypothetical protein
VVVSLTQPVKYEIIAVQLEIK